MTSPRTSLVEITDGLNYRVSEVLDIETKVEGIQGSADLAGVAISEEGVVKDDMIAPPNAAPSYFLARNGTVNQFTVAVTKVVQQARYLDSYLATMLQSMAERAWRKRTDPDPYDFHRTDVTQGPALAATGIPGAGTANVLPRFGEDFTWLLSEWADNGEVLGKSLAAAAEQFQEEEDRRATANADLRVPGIVSR